MYFNRPGAIASNVPLYPLDCIHGVECCTQIDTTLQGMNMNEIIQRLIERTGLPEDKAATAVETVVGFLKEKLPAPVASQIDSLLSSDSGMADKLGGMGASLGGLFGKKE